MYNIKNEMQLKCKSLNFNENYSKDSLDHSLIVFVHNLESYKCRYFSPKAATDLDPSDIPYPIRNLSVTSRCLHSFSFSSMGSNLKTTPRFSNYYVFLLYVWPPSIKILSLS